MPISHYSFNCTLVKFAMSHLTMVKKMPKYNLAQTLLLLFWCGEPIILGSIITIVLG